MNEQVIEQRRRRIESVAVAAEEELFGSLELYRALWQLDIDVMVDLVRSYDPELGAKYADWIGEGE